MAAVDIPRWMWALTDEYPFGQPPPGVKPNFENPELVGGHSMTIVSSICVVLLFIVSSLRLYSKLRIMRKTTIDDYFFWISLPMLLLVLSIYLYLDNHGAYGYHAWDVKIKSLTKPILVVTFVQQIVMPIAIWLIKATLILLILTAFRPIRWLRILCWVGLSVTFVFYTISLILNAVPCHPRGGTDRISYLAGMASLQCAGNKGLVQRASIATGSFGVISDLYILIIPLPAVAKLHLGKRRKLGVFLIFSSGALACIASVLSLTFRVRAFGTKDLTVDSIPTMTCHLVELTVGLSLTCIAPIAKLVQYTLNTRSPTTTTGYSDDSGGEKRANRRKHAPGGLSELDSLKTFGTTIDGTTIDVESTSSIKQSSSIDSHSQ